MSSNGRSRLRRTSVLLLPLLTVLLLLPEPLRVLLQRWKTVQLLWMLRMKPLRLLSRQPVRLPGRLVLMLVLLRRWMVQMPGKLPWLIFVLKPASLVMLLVVPETLMPLELLLRPRSPFQRHILVQRGRAVRHAGYMTS